MTFIFFSFSKNVLKVFQSSNIFDEYGNTNAVRSLKFRSILCRTKLYRFN